MSKYLQLVVDLEPDTTPIRGRISSPSDPVREFHGWLELASAIEALRNDAVTVNHPVHLDEPAHGHTNAT